jgi:hypothetical protein
LEFFGNGLSSVQYKVDSIDVEIRLLVQPMVNQVQSFNTVLLSCFPNKDVDAVDFLKWCEDKVRHIVARLLEMLSNRQADTMVASLDNSVVMSHNCLLSCAACLSCLLRSAGACTSSSFFLGASAYVYDVGGLAVDLALNLDLLTRQP